MKSHIIAFALLYGMTSWAYAFDGDRHCKNKEYGKKQELLQNMTQEERAEYKAIKSKLKSMTKEERQDFRREVKSKWSTLTQDQKNDFINENKEQINKILDRKKEKVIMKLYGTELMKNRDH